MLAASLRLKIAIELTVAFVAALIFGASLAMALLLSLAVLFALHAASMLVTFWLDWPLQSKPCETGVFANLRMIAAECLAYFALFAVIQPFDSLFMPVPAAQPASPDKLPVLFVHGYLCNRGAWWRLAARLRRQGIASRALSLEPPLASIDALANQLNAHIEAYVRDSGGEKLVLVTHSMGGLVARAYLKRYGGMRVSKLITLACPHHGTRIARLGFGRNAREMEPGSAWIHALGATISVPFVSVWSTHDNFVSPQPSAHIEGAQEIVLHALGHLSFVFSDRVFRILLKELS